MPADLFIVGVPRGATTSLASWLAGHSLITLSRPKEPGYFAHDLVMNDRITTAEAYRQAFAVGRGRESHRLDATVWYLYSLEAASAIARTADDPRIIVCLRDIPDQLASLHRRHVFSGFEAEPDFEKAVFGPSRPARDDDFRYSLDYLDVGRVGEQVARYIDAVGRDRIRFVDFEVIRRDPLAVYAGMLEWLGLPFEDEVSNFKARNRGKLWRSPALAQRLRGTAGPESSLVRRRAVGLLTRLNTRQADAGPSPVIRRRITDALADDLALLEEITGRDLAGRGR